ncbi:MAG: TlpA family protein disulfide reductase [Bacteroidetes bacterium]|nr:TlpA family protein disulfide reductase [Bacteroidota bacterium]
MKKEQNNFRSGEKMNKKQVMIFISGILFLGVFGLIAQNKITDNQRKAIEELTGNINQAPDFTLMDINDEEITLSDLKGKVVIVNFWATWCGPCRIEIPEFNNLVKKHKDELVILGISISDTKKALKNFAKSFNVDYPLLYGSSRDIEKVSRDYGGIYSVPMTFLIDKTGEIRMSYPGALMKGHPMHTQFQSDVNLSLAQPYQK